MPIINLHAHTEYSDGAGKIVHMADTCKKLGFSACVITDHVYAEDRDYSNSYPKFIKQCMEAEEASKEVGIPIIVGAEISIMRLEECLLFGRDAIEALLKMRNEKILRKYDPMIEPMCSIKELAEIRAKHESACFLCHPSLRGFGIPGEIDWVSEGGVDVIDGYEFINSAQKQFGKFQQIPDEFESLIQLCNSDAHNPITLEWCYNETTEAITTEEELIAYVKGGGEFKHILNMTEKGLWSGRGPWKYGDS